MANYRFWKIRLIPTTIKWQAMNKYDPTYCWTWYYLKLISRIISYGDIQAKSYTTPWPFQYKVIGNNVKCLFDLVKLKKEVMVTNGIKSLNSNLICHQMAV